MHIYTPSLESIANRMKTVNHELDKAKQQKNKLEEEI